MKIYISLDGVNFSQISGDNILRNSVTIEDQIHNSLKPTISVCRFRIKTGSTLINLIIGSLIDIPLYVEAEDSSRLFTGFIRKNLEISLSGKLSSYLDIEAVDNSYLLKKLIKDDLYQANRTVFYLVNFLLLYGGIPGSLFPSQVISDVVTHFYIGASDNQTIEGALSQLLYEHGWVYFADKDGNFQLLQLVIDSPTSTFTFNDENSFRGQTVNRAEIENDSIEIKFPQYETKSDSIVSKDTTGGNNFYEMLVSIPPGGFYPNGASSTAVVFTKFKVDGGDLIYVDSPSIDWKADSGIVLLRSNFQQTRADIAFQNTSGVSQNLYRFRVKGTAVLKSGQNVIYADDGTQDYPVSMEARYLSDVTLAERLADYHYRWLKNSAFKYSLGSTESRPLGEIVTVSNASLGLNTKGRIIRRYISTAKVNSYEYLIEGVGNFTSGVNLSEVEWSPGNTLPIVNFPEIGEILTEYPSLEDLGYIWATQIPLAVEDLTAKSAFTNIFLSWRQNSQLTNFDHFQIQCSLLDSATQSQRYSPDRGDFWVNYLGTFSRSFTTKFDHLSIPNAGTPEIPAGRTVYYWVRVVTKAALKEDQTYYTEAEVPTAFGPWSGPVSATTYPIREEDLSASIISSDKLTVDSVTAQAIASGAVTLDKLEAGIIEAYIANILGFITIGETGFTGANYDLSQESRVWDGTELRAYIDNNEITFQKQTATGATPTWVDTIRLSEDENGLRFYDLNHGITLTHTDTTKYSVLLGKLKSLFTNPPAGMPDYLSLSLESDGLITFCETDTNRVVGFMDMNTGDFQWEGNLSVGGNITSSGLITASSGVDSSHFNRLKIYNFRKYIITGSWSRIFRAQTNSGGRLGFSAIVNVNHTRAGVVVSASFFYGQNHSGVTNVQLYQLYGGNYTQISTAAYSTGDTYDSYFEILDANGTLGDAHEYEIQVILLHGNLEYTEYSVQLGGSTSMLKRVDTFSGGLGGMNTSSVDGNVNTYIPTSTHGGVSVFNDNAIASNQWPAIQIGANHTWDSTLKIGGQSGGTHASVQAIVATSNGNLHLDSKTGYTTYLNYYSGGQVMVGTGQPTAGMALSVAGDMIANKVWNAVFNDLAEFIGQSEEHPIAEAGQVLVQTKTGLAPSSKRADKAVVGVYSDSFGYALQTKYKDTGGYPVGLSGTLQVWLKEPAEIGDLLVSDVDGFASVATDEEAMRPGVVLGKLLEGKEGTEPERKLSLILMR